MHATLRPYWHPLTAGIALGVVLLMTFLVTGHGLGLFAGVFDSIEAFYEAGGEVPAQTLDEYFGIPAVMIIAALALLAVLAFRVGSKLEAQRGGPISAMETTQKS